MVESMNFLCPMGAEELHAAYPYVDTVPLDVNFWVIGQLPPEVEEV